MSLLQIHEPGQTPQPHAEAAKKAVGIDLGTTHSVIAFSDAQSVRVFGDEQGRTIIPSVVQYGDDLVRSVKRRMHEASTPLRVNGTEVTPIEVSAQILKNMKALAERELGEAIEQAVITVPAYFDDTARTATRDAARLAGLEVLRLINEPTAAALAYGLDHQAEGTFVIYDLGGGTFDVSILKLQGGVFQVLATAGDTQLGGDDFDELLANELNVSSMDARVIKEKLSESDEVSGLSRQRFDALIAPLVSRTVMICEQALKDAGLEKNQIDGVVLVGGSTRVPLVRAQIESFFGQKPLDNIDPDEVVAVGAAIQAEALSVGADHLLLDVTPLSLGLETMGGLVEKIIYRNSPIPVSAHQEFTTYQDGQSGMKIHVVQGERELVDQCRSLARFTLSGIPPLPANVARVRVTFTVDADGLLTVSAKEMESGTQQRVEVKPSHGLPIEQIEAMLRASMENAQGDILQRLLVQARVEAERTIHDVQSAIEKDGDLLNDKELAAIHAQIETLKRAVTGDSRDAIDAHAQQLNELSNPFAARRMDKAIASALQGAHIDEIVNE